MGPIFPATPYGVPKGGVGETTGAGIGRPHAWQNRASEPFGRPHSGQNREFGGAVAGGKVAVLCRADSRAAATSGGRLDPVDPERFGVEGDRRPFATIPKPARQTIVPIPNPA